MDKKLFIIAGCNGAGKTTAFRTMLSAQLGNPIFVNPDVIARNLDANHQWEARISAGRETLLQMDANMERGDSFCVETTLTSRSYVQMIKRLTRKGIRLICIIIGWSRQMHHIGVCFREWRREDTIQVLIIT